MDDYKFKRVFLSRVVIVLSILLIALVGILLQLFSLQVGSYEYYKTLAEGNRFKIAPIQASRGLIYDRDGHPLATNKTVYSLEMPSRFNDKLPQVLAQVGEIIGTMPGEEKHLNQVSNYLTGVYNTILRSNLSEEEVAKLAINMHQLQNVEINGLIMRYYPYKDLFAHIIGYVSLLSAKDLKRIDPRNYRGQRYIGKTGIERFYEQDLHGKIGFSKIEVNAKGRFVRKVDSHLSKPGKDLMLTISKRIQQSAFDALGEHNGAIIVMNVHNGDVLAAVSRPSFDANLLGYSFSHSAYQKLQANPFKPFFNRAISGQYAPGSTIKPVVALAGLSYGIVGQEDYIYAGPYYQIPGQERHYRDWYKRGHGRINLSGSITQSCDVFFYDLAYKTGIRRLAPFIKRFGFGKKTGIDTTSEASGLVPTPAWKLATLQQSWLPAETVISGIGQGYLLATPIQLAVATAAIATRGKHVVPRVVKAIRHGGEWKEQPVQRKKDIQLQQSDWDYVIKAMRNVVHRSNGTAFRISHNINYLVAGKTGTVQVVSMPEEGEEEIPTELRNKLLEDHGMFIAFAPADKPEIVIATVAEHSGSGAIAAAISRKVLDAYFSQKRAQ